MNNADFWRGVQPAITTPFTDSGEVDHHFLGQHARHLVDADCSGLVPLGSLGESARLSFEEKGAIVRTLVEAVGAWLPALPRCPRRKALSWSTPSNRPALVA